MAEPTWHRTEVPPLRADIDRRLRALRRSLRRIERGWGFSLAALVGLLAGALGTLPPGSFMVGG